MPETATLASLNLGDIITFNTYGTSIPNVVNGTILSFESGTSLRNPPAAAVNAANIYGSLPQINGVSVPTNYTAYNYLLIQLPDGTELEIGYPWINPISLTRLTRATISIQVLDTDPSQVAVLQNLLTVNGFLNTVFNVINL